MHSVPWFESSSGSITVGGSSFFFQGINVSPSFSCWIKSWGSASLVTNPLFLYFIFSQLTVYSTEEKRRLSVHIFSCSLKSDTKGEVLVAKPKAI